MAHFINHHAHAAVGGQVSHQGQKDKSKTAGSIGHGTLGKMMRMPLNMLRRFSTPMFVPAVQPLELFFFQRVFDHLVTQAQLKHAPTPDPEGCPILSSRDDLFSFAEGASHRSGDSPVSRGGLMGEDSWLRGTPSTQEPREVPLVKFHSAMVRLFRILQQPYPEVKAMGANATGRVGWYEFCSFWKENKIAVRLTWAERLFLTLEDSERSILGRVMSVIVFIFIIISTGCFIISTMPEFQSKCILEGDPGFDASCKPKPDPFFKDVDLACVIFFSIEYSIRLLLSGVMRNELVGRDKAKLLEWMVTDDNYKQPHAMRRISEFFFEPANLVDLAAIMPWFLTEAFKSSGGEDSIIIRMIRLTRVIRAFRLGARFEAVIIIVRSIRRSLRALYVLVLNLALGVIIFGALMFFCEQGKWDHNKRAYVRKEGVIWNTVTRQWDSNYVRSPFESIPASFWWAVVTATTVGYGDQYPTTGAGKAVAGVSMAWSLCVLALPIGVIGSNFSQVWDEYDKEKEREEWDRIKEEMMLKRSIAWGDPLYYSRRVLLEVWHDAGLPDDEQQSEFMGEVDCSLDLPEKESVRKLLTMDLTSNYEKARRRVRGTLTFEYRWWPADKQNEDTLLLGTLEIHVLHGENFINIDWKDSCTSDAYCKIWAYPHSPRLDGHVEPVCGRTHTVWDTSNPRWNYTITFNVNWTRAGTAQVMRDDMRDLAHGVEQSSKVSMSDARTSMKTRTSYANQHARPSSGVDRGDLEPQELMSRMMPELQAEVQHLRDSAVPQLQSEIEEVRDDLQRIIEALTKRAGQQSSRHSRHKILQ